MAEKKKGLGLPQTRGSFQIRGKVSGTQKDNFYTEKITKTGKPWRSVNFGVEFANGSIVYLGLNGMERDSVYFSKRNEEGKTETKAVPWKDRFTFAEEGYSIIGTNIGVKRILDAKGNEVNDKKRLTEYDACKEISDNLVDDKTVFARGNIEFSSYNDNHQTRFVPSQVSLGKDVDFDAEDFRPTADFTQMIVFMGISKSDDGSKFIVSAKIVNYNSIEDAEVIIKDAGLANVFRKNLKPYTSINVWGSISVERDTTEVEVNDCWGSKNKMERVNNPTVRELVIEGADPDTIDVTTYSEAEMDKAIEAVKAAKAAENDFGGSTEGWGSTQFSFDDDEDAGW